MFDVNGTTVASVTGAATDVLAIKFDMRTTLGPVVIGCLLSVLLFGFTVMQLISYMQYSFEDPLYIKTIVSTSISQASLNLKPQLMAVDLNLSLRCMTYSSV